MAIKNVKQSKVYTVVCGFDIDSIPLRKESGDELKESEVKPDQIKTLLEMGCIEEK
jgi:hypothetical protein